jgi:hypothetical protein
VHEGRSLRLPVLLTVALVGVLGLIYGASNGARRSIHPGAAKPPAVAAPAPPADAAVPALPAPLSARVAGRLTAPLEHPAVVPVADGGVLVIGGLGAGDLSSAGVELAGSGRSRLLGQLATAPLDAAAAPVAGGAYVFGGGSPATDAIVRVSAASGRATAAGRLPVATAEAGAARIGDSFYVVGGYTGVKALRTIVEWRPGAARGRVVARLPAALRFPAVAAAPGGRIVIAGGSTGTSASRAVYSFDPAAAGAPVRRIATLPRPLTHASAATLGGVVYVIGGRGAAPDSQSRRLLSIDLGSGRVRAAGLLPRALSDTGVAAVRGAIVVAGGRDSSGRARSEVLRLDPR